MEKTGYIAGCGIEIREREGFVCPYYSRPQEWDEDKRGHGPCQIDLQFGTNVCLHAPEWFFERQRLQFDK